MKGEELETSCGVIEVDMFGEEVNDPEDPEAVKFKKLLEDVAEEYRCNLLLFEVDHGKVSFAFDSEELTFNIIKVLSGTRT